MDKEIGKYRVLITAAGCSRRMKKFKPLLPLGDQCILEHTINRFKEAGLQDIVVVVGYRRNELMPILSRMGVHIVINELFDESDMLASVKLGLQVMTADTRGVLLCPADIPLIDPLTIIRLIEEGKQSSAFAVIPTYLGRRGHPILFGRRIISEILQFHGDNGLHGILDKFSDRIAYIPVLDSNMLMDIDRPEDYQRLLDVYESHQHKEGDHAPTEIPLSNKGMSK